MRHAARRGRRHRVATVYVVGPIPAVAFYAARIVLRTASITRRDLGIPRGACVHASGSGCGSRPSCGSGVSLLSSRAPHRRRQCRRCIITAVSIDFPGIIASAAAVVGLDLVTLAQTATAARRARPGPRSVLLADQALRDPRFPLAVVVVDVVGVVPAVSTRFCQGRTCLRRGNRLRSYRLTESIAAAVGIAAPAAERRDEAPLDARLGLTVVICVWTTSKVPRRGRPRAREILPGYFMLRPARGNE